MAYTTINKSSEHFNTKLYTGNQSSTHAVTGVGFQPDLSWLKIRTGTGSHYLYRVWIRREIITCKPNSTRLIVQTSALYDAISLYYGCV